jgi:mRNA deadenylase 3'-5' endonuclease subunit Ccr4
MSLHVMTYNILDGGENRKAHILDVIQTAKPDVVILQEVFTEEFLKFLSHSLGMNYYIGIGNKKTESCTTQQSACSKIQKSSSTFSDLAKFY